jgi:hypothetical protein
MEQREGILCLIYLRMCKVEILTGYKLDLLLYFK